MLWFVQNFCYPNFCKKTASTSNYNFIYIVLIFWEVNQLLWEAILLQFVFSFVALQKICSCETYGSCCFSHNIGMCFANSPKYYNHWRRGKFKNMLITFSISLSTVVSLAEKNWSCCSLSDFGVSNILQLILWFIFLRLLPEVVLSCHLL